MTNQFLHYSSYGRAPKKGAKDFECISGTLAEASRLPSATKHLTAPMTPRLLYGVMPIELEDRALYIAHNAVDLTYRRTRPDASVLVAGVASFPISVVGRDPDELEQWLSAVLNWLKKKHGDRLRSVVLHMDERYPHVHFYTLPELREDWTLDWTAAHPGLANKRLSQLLEEEPIMQDRCYRAAMERTQDDFHAQVSSRFGHQRFGPRRRRFDRDEALLRQQVEDERRAARSEIAEQQRVVLAEIERREKALEEHEAHMRQRVTQIREQVELHMRQYTVRMSPVERSLIKDSADRLHRKLVTLANSPDHAPDTPLALSGR